MADPLARYKAKRNFGTTPEPAGDGPLQKRKGKSSAAQFVIQKHWARNLHYDLRLQIGGAMRSWAVPKGPSLDPGQKRVAVAVEDHPISYNQFEGKIPDGQYGAGRVIVWDKGLWLPDGDPETAFRGGRMRFTLQGHKLRGRWTLIRTARKGSTNATQWLLIKERDDEMRAAAQYDVLEDLPESVARLPHPMGPATGPVTTDSATTAKALPVCGASARALASAPTAALPVRLAPALATLVTQPAQPYADWQYELKFDGYRILARVEGERVQLLTRNGNDWTRKMPDIADSVRRLGLGLCWLDGEIVMPDAHGVPDFNGLQNAFDARRPKGLVYYLFDLPYYAGKDLRQLPLVQRRAILESATRAGTDDAVRLSERFDADPQDLIASACKIGFEGVVGKLGSSGYPSGRTESWVKLKCGLRQEFVIGGFTLPRGARSGFGALLLGVYDRRKQLRYVGKAGTGFDNETLSRLHTRMLPLQQQDSPFAAQVDAARGTVRWVKPQLVAEIAFAAWTPANHIRHAVFKGMRDDRPAVEVSRERPVRSATGDARRVRVAASKATVGQIPITHGTRVIDPRSGATKLELVQYYASVAPLMLEHLRERPVALVRAPEGVGGSEFFQKHQKDAAKFSHISALAPELDPDHAPLLEVATQSALTEAAQFNVFEFHTWNARKDRIERPDRMCFDLDPGERVAWEDVLIGADLVHILLQELALPSFLKTSGGKGLHVVVPIKRLYDWGVVKGFSAAIVQHLARVIPQRFVAKSGPRNRVGKIFVDYLRNGRGAMTASAWSARARPGIGISVPVEWAELGDLTGGAHWNIENIAQRLDKGNTPWETYPTSATALTEAMHALGYDRTSSGE